MNDFIIATDFDGTIVANKFPEIGEPLKGFTDKLLIEELYKLKKKSAELMLEQLGYKNTGYLTGNSINFENKDCETSISIFDNERGRDIHIYALGDTYKNSGFIGVEELKAIYMYCSALGWFDDNSN